MTAIFAYPPITFKGPNTIGERSLSLLSHYFYLGGRNAVVLNENHKTSWAISALKVASYLIFAPITPLLFIAYLTLRHIYGFKVIEKSSPPESKSVEFDNPPFDPEPLFSQETALQNQETERQQAGLLPSSRAAHVDEIALLAAFREPTLPEPPANVSIMDQLAQLFETEANKPVTIGRPNQIGIIKILKGPNAGLATIEQSYDSSRYTHDDVTTVLADLLVKDRHTGHRLKEILEAAKIEELVSHLQSTNLLYKINAHNMGVLLDVLQEQNIAIDLHLKDPSTSRSLLDIHYKNEKILNSLLNRDPSLIEEAEVRELLWVDAFSSGQKGKVKAVVHAAEKCHIELSPKERLYARVALEDTSTKEEIQALDQEEQTKLYQLANQFSCFNTLRVMRLLGFMPSQTPIKSIRPSPFNCCMDALEREDRLTRFLKEMQTKGLLVTKSGYESIKDKYTHQEGSVSDLFARNHLEQAITATKLNLVHVPKKVLITKDNGPLALTVESTLEIVSKDVQIACEKVEGEERAFRPEEIRELMQLCASANFKCPAREDLVLTSQGIYILNTSFLRFWDPKMVQEGRSEWHYHLRKMISTLPYEEGRDLSTLLSEMENDYAFDKEFDGAYQEHIAIEETARSLTHTTKTEHFINL